MAATGRYVNMSIIAEKPRADKVPSTGTLSSGFTPTPLSLLPTLGQGAKVLGGLYTHFYIKRDGKTWDSDEALAGWCGVSVRTYQRQFPKLAQYVWIDSYKWTPKGHRVSVTKMDRDLVDGVKEPFAPIPKWTFERGWPWARQAVYALLVYRSHFLEYGLPQVVDDLSIAVIARATALGESTVKDAVRWLHENGVVERQHHPGNVLRVKLDLECLERMGELPRTATKEPDEEKDMSTPEVPLCEVVAEAETLLAKGLGKSWHIVPDLIATYRKRYKLSPRQRAALERFIERCEEDLAKGNGRKTNYEGLAHRGEQAARSNWDGTW